MAAHNGTRAHVRARLHDLDVVLHFPLVLLVMLCCHDPSHRCCGVSAIELDVAAWNIQTFGVAKMSDTSIAAVIASTVGG